MLNMSFSNNENPDGGLTAGLQKGVILHNEGTPLCEEGMGFGVPVIVNRYGTYLSFTADLEEQERNGSRYYIKTFYMDALQRAKTGGKEIESDLRYRWIEARGWVYKRFPLVQRFLPVALTARRKAGVEFFFKKVDPPAIVRVLYRIGQDNIDIEIDHQGSIRAGGSARLYILNEQGAGVFDNYSDSSGADLKKSAIGGWINVDADKAWMMCKDKMIGFAVNNHPRIPLYRGWEKASDTLSWSGFIYDLTKSGRESFAYRIEVIGKKTGEA